MAINDSLGKQRTQGDAYYNKQLKELDKSLKDIREKHEQELQSLRTKNIKALSQMSLKAQNDLAKADMNLALKVSNYQNELKDKYSKRYTKEMLDNASMQKRIAKEVEDYIYTEKQKRRSQERTEEMQRISDVKNARIQADLDIFNKKMSLIKSENQLRLEHIKIQQQKNLAAFKAGRKDEEAYDKKRRQLQAKEDKQRLKTAEKMRKQGFSEREILEVQAEGRDKSRIGGAAWDAQMKLNGAQALGTMINGAFNNLKQMFESTIKTYGEYQTKINTRLQGSGKSWQGGGVGSLFGLGGGIEANIKNAVGNNPYVQLQKVMDNVVKATEQGIAYNIEQRAFLETISDSIATTFNAFDSNLTRIIRVQQADTTAARLGLEAGLTSFFNETYQDTSYLDNAFDTVSQSLFQTTSQLSAQAGVELEYVVQKWLGSLYSVGFGEDALGRIAQAIGYLGSGNVSALASDSEMQNLIVMAASRANMSYSDMLIDGIDASDTNKLMRSMVTYLEEIAESDNKVVKSEYAKVFGMSVADLQAVKNIEDTLPKITNSMMSYGGAVDELYSQMGQLSSRTSIAGMMGNLFENAKYSMGTGIAANPVTYALWEVTSMIEDLTGGIALPTVSMMGNMVDLNTTVTNLMRAGIVGISSLGAIGSMISGISSTANPATMLSKLGIANTSDVQTLTRGRGLGKQKQLNQASSSTAVGNTAGADYYDSAMAAADETADKKAKQAQEENVDINLNNIHEYLLSVFDPKITEIERLTALIAGYNVGPEKSWGSFKGSGTGNYSASTVQVNYGSNGPTSRLDTSAILSTISENTSSILNVLKGTLNVRIAGDFIGLGNSAEFGLVSNYENNNGE